MACHFCSSQGWPSFKCEAPLRKADVTIGIQVISAVLNSTGSPVRGNWIALLRAFFETHNGSGLELRFHYQRMWMYVTCTCIYKRAERSSSSIPFNLYQL